MIAVSVPNSLIRLRNYAPVDHRQCACRPLSVVPPATALPVHHRRPLLLCRLWIVVIEQHRLDVGAHDVQPVQLLLGSDLPKVAFRNVNVNSMILVMKYLPTLCWLITLPTRMPISAAPRSGSLARCAALMVGASFSSVAANNSCRLRWRCSANIGLRQTISQSPGKSGPQVFADACSGEHAVVADQHHAPQPEAVADLVYLPGDGDGLGVAGGALEYLDTCPFARRGHSRDVRDWVRTRDNRYWRRDGDHLARREIWSACRGCGRGDRSSRMDSPSAPCADETRFRSTTRGSYSRPWTTARTR